MFCLVFCLFIFTADVDSTAVQWRVVRSRSGHYNSQQQVGDEPDLYGSTTDRDHPSSQPLSVPAAGEAIALGHQS